MHSIYFFVDEYLINIRSNQILAHFNFAPDVAEFKLIAPWLLDLSEVFTEIFYNLQNVEETAQKQNLWLLLYDSFRLKTSYLAVAMSTLTLQFYVKWNNSYFIAIIICMVWKM